MPRKPPATHLKGQSLKSWEEWISNELIQDGRTPQVFHPTDGRRVYEHIMTAFLELVQRERSRQHG